MPEKLHLRSKYSWDGVTTNNLYMIEIGAESGTSTQTNITLRNRR